MEKAVNQPYFSTLLNKIMSQSSQRVSVLTRLDVNLNEQVLEDEVDDLESDVDDRLNNEVEDDSEGESESDNEENDGNEVDGVFVDLVSPTARIHEFNKIHPINERHVNSWIDMGVVPYKDGDEFKVGQCFSNKSTLRDAVTRYNVKKHHSFSTKESKASVVAYKCGRKHNPCNWMLRGRLNKNRLGAKSFKITAYNGPHEITCVGRKVSRDHPNLKRGFISQFIRGEVEADWGLRICVIIVSVRKQFNYTISYKKAWQAKQKAIAEIFGDWEESFEKLPSYLEAIKKANPTTEFEFKHKSIGSSNTATFGKVFWAFGPSITGFDHCRPLLTIDGTHLYGKYKGVLMIVMSIDANDQLYPLAFGIVDKESIETWTWFLGRIRKYVTKRRGLCVISDRHTGIMHAMNEDESGWEEPYAYHRFCIRHHASNINKKYKDVELKKLFTRTAFAHQESKFDHYLRELDDHCPEARIDLDNINDNGKWSICHDGGRRYGIITTNLAEVFNNVLKGARCLPITSLVEVTFHRVNAYFVERRELAMKRLSNNLRWSEKITNQIGYNNEKAFHHRVRDHHTRNGVYAIRTSKGNHRHKVDISNKTCTCNKWQIYHYPCSHLMAVCQHLNVEPDDYVDPFYSCGEYFESYKVTLFPIADEAYWDPYTGPKIQPDVSLLRGKGRPKSKRLRNEMDENPKSKQSCSMCRQEGHNKRKCPSTNTG